MAVTLGSKEWFKGLADSLFNAGLTVLTNKLTAKKTAEAPTSSTSSSAGGFSLSGLKWLPYAIAGAVVLIFVLVLRKK